jgi:hypothetical protein
MKAEVERAGADGGRRVADDKLARLTDTYDRLIAEGLRAQPPPQVPVSVRKQARNLLLRLEWRKGEVLRFLTDFAVPFDRYERRRSRAHSPGPTEPYALGFGGLLHLAGWRTARLITPGSLSPCAAGHLAHWSNSALACDH